MEWHCPSFDELARRAYLLACDMERVRYWAERIGVREIETELHHINYGAVAMRTLSLAAQQEHVLEQRERERVAAERDEAERAAGDAGS